MATVDMAPQSSAFIRPDGKEKVTGHGPLHGRPRRSPDRLTRSSATPTTRTPGSRGSTRRRRGRCPGVLAVVTHDDVPDVPLRRHGAGPPPVREGHRALRGRHRRRRRRDHRRRSPRAAAALIEVDYEPLAGRHRLRGGDGRRRAARPPRLGSATSGDENIGRDGNTLGYSTIVKGDADAAMAGADVVVKGRYVTDPSQGVPIEPRAVVAQWQGDKVTIWTSTQVPVRRPRGVAHDAADPRVARARDRAAPRRRLRRQVRLPLRGARRGARPGRAAAR